MILNNKNKPMIKYYILILFTVLISISCGRNKAEIELEKAKIELEKTKLELAEKNKKEEKTELNKIHDQKVNVGKRKKITELNLQLQKLPMAIEKAEKNIKKINAFEIGRSSSTKENQLQEAKNQLLEIRNYGEKIKNEIAQLEFHKTFNFQKNPESVMEYIFKSAKKGDFSNFRNLCDPYGENDSDVNQICYAEMMMENQRAKLKKEFQNGRVIGKALINGDKAEVEFAFGSSANRLEKMKMIKRNDLWYLSGF